MLHGSFLSLFMHCMAIYQGTFKAEFSQPNKPYDVGGTILTGPKGEVNNLVYSPDGKLLASSQGKSVVVWDVDAKKKVLELDHEDATFLFVDISISADGKKLAVSKGSKESVAIYDIKSQKIIKSFPKLWQGLFSPKSDLLAFTFENRIEIWNLTGDKPVSTVKLNELAGPLSWSANGEQVLIRTNTRLLIWTIKDKEPTVIVNLKGGERVFQTVYLAEHKQFVEMWIWNETWLYDLGAKKYTKKILPLGATKAVNSLAYDPKQNRLAIGGVGKTISLINMDKPGKAKAVAAGDCVGAIAFSPDGKKLAIGYAYRIGDNPGTANDGRIQIVDIE